MTCCETSRPCGCCRPCPCCRPPGDCGPDDDPTCELECLERPVFKPGQRLCAPDLDNLVAYADGRFGLVRYRHGWGIVCGLQVRPDPGCDTRVVIEQGYAVDCCGNDVVLCAPASLDLKRFCRKRESCLDEDEDPDDQNGDGDGDGNGNGDGGDGDGACRIGGRSIKLRRLVRVDIVLSRSQPGSGQRGGIPHARLSVPPPDLAAAFAEAWRATAAPFEGDLQVFPLFDGQNDDGWRALDRRLGVLARRCHPCTPEDVLRLGRVWIYRRPARGEKPACCQIVYIDLAEPWRRPFRPDWPPAPRGHVNLAALIFWQQPEVAFLRLAQAGLKEKGTRRRDNVDELMHPPVAAPEPFVNWSWAGKVQTVKVDALDIGERVVGWIP
jgi:hypothetical protein